MTDQDDEQPLTPEEESRIRSALASARVTGATPDDVAARLDVLLADLVAERDVPGAVAGTGRRSTRRTGRWLLLAGAASVAAIAAFNVPALHPGGSDETAAGDSATSSSQDSREAPKSAPSARAGTESQYGAAGDQQLLRLSSRSFRADVRRGLGSPAGLGAMPRAERSPAELDAPACDLTTQSPGSPPGVERRQVLLDGEPALLEVFTVRGGTRLVRAVGCDGSTLASARIPAP